MSEDNHSAITRRQAVKLGAGALAMPTVLPSIESRPGPSPYLESLVASGKLGMKSGEGFRTWTAEEQAELRQKVVQHLKKARQNDA